MSTADKQISAAVALVALIHAAILITALVSPGLGAIVYLNLIVSVSLLLYWVQKQIRIQQHVVELREVVALAFETAVAGCSIYALTGTPARWLWVTHVVISGVHFLAVLAFFIFMLTFRIKKLF
ncbi:hypothetical protein [Chryseolinea soli]|uniref:Uncharacterized protein n=1 Tax=Chryseolinea soli TaxID=2321403 RepID=A0A385SGC3_9BACT|nr:hypothetical protein [Chryseolinea soli]AYB29922.1 hypothetical protein D4L85_04715 [Chryseolinea soli]